METLLEAKKVRAIGVSNYTVRHLEELLAHNPKVAPFVNQVEFHPWFRQRELLAFCEGNGILMQAYSSLGQGTRWDDAVVKEVAERKGKTLAQVLLRWAIQHRVPVIPRSSRKERIAENYALFDFELEKEDMQALDSIEQQPKICWDPEGIL